MFFEEERWAIYGGHYIVSSEGKVFNTETNRYLKPYSNNLGYYYVNLKIDGQRKQCRLHSLVAHLFLDCERDDLEVDHIDADKSNNSVKNLQFMTHRQNVQKAQNRKRYNVEDKGLWQ